MYPYFSYFCINAALNFKKAILSVHRPYHSIFSRQYYLKSWKHRPDPSHLEVTYSIFQNSFAIIFTQNSRSLCGTLRFVTVSLANIYPIPIVDFLQIRRFTVQPWSLFLRVRSLCPADRFTLLRFHDTHATRSRWICMVAYCRTCKKKPPRKGTTSYLERDKDALAG